MRVSHLLIFTLFAPSLLAQSDSTSEDRDWKIGFDIVGTLAMPKVPSYAGQLRLRIGRSEWSASAGAHKDFLADVKDFDEVNVEGKYLTFFYGYLFEAFYHTEFAFINQANFKLGAGLTFTQTDITFTERFTSRPPFEEYVYSRDYKNAQSISLPVYLGYHLDLFKYAHVGIGVPVYFTLKSDDTPPKRINALVGRSPLALQVQAGVQF